MTPAEYKTIREACGLSQQAAADFHAVRLRTIQHWEAGRNAVPDGAAGELLGLDRRLERAVAEAVHLYHDKRTEFGEPSVVALVRYRTAAAFAGSRPESEGLTLDTHAALIGRLRRALEAAGAQVTIAWAG